MNNFGVVAYFFSLLLTFACCFPDVDYGDFEYVFSSATNEASDCEKLILTPYLKNGKIKEAKKLSYVNMESIFENITSYSGYITIDETFNSNTWFWYFAAEEVPVEKAPLIIWLQGGPGLSSLFGLFEEIGPFSLKENGTELIRNEYSWHKKHSLLFIDNPIGTGFSFTDHNEGYAKNQSMISKHLYEFIIQFLQIFPELKEAPVFLAGESYAGKHLPAFACEIHDRNPTADIKIDLKGIAIGNPFIDSDIVLDLNKFYYQLGLVDDSSADNISGYETEFKEAVKMGNYSAALDLHMNILYELKEKSQILNIYNYVNEDAFSFDSAYTEYVQLPEIRAILHVCDAKFSAPNTVYDNLYEDILTSSKKWLERVLENYKVLFFNGNLDLVIPYYSSVQIYRSLEWSGAEEYQNATRSVMFMHNKVVGYVRNSKNFYEVMIKNAGHMVAKDQPKRALALIKSFIKTKYKL